RVPERDEERVLRVPRVVAGAGIDARDVAGVVLAPVELAGGQHVGAATTEAVVEQSIPFLDALRLAEELAAGGVAAVDGRDREVVPGGPVEVDDDRLVAERLGDRARDRSQELEQVSAGPNPRGDLEEASQRRYGWERWSCHRKTPFRGVDRHFRARDVPPKG